MGRAPGANSVVFAGSCERTHWMDAFFLTTHSLFTASTRNQATGSSAGHCRGVGHFELQAFRTPKLHTVRRRVFELFRKTEANFSWRILLSCYPNLHLSHVELCHIKCTKAGIP